MMTTPTTNMMSMWKNLSPRAKIFLTIAFGVGVASELSVYRLAMQGGNREKQQQTTAIDPTYDGLLEWTAGEDHDQ